MKNKKSARQGGRSMAFTLVEMLIVIGIIAILIALLLPALTTVKKMAKEAQQKAQFTTIELALTAFKNDYGDYPPSHGYTYLGGQVVDDYYFGAETLTEALVGWDLMGFHPKSAWWKNGLDKDGLLFTYDPFKSRDDNGDGIPDTLTERKGLYLELATANVFKLSDLFSSVPGSFNQNNFVICDVFGAKSVTVGGKVVKAGNPILYYRANTSSKTIDATAAPNEEDRIYNRMDNYNFLDSLGGKGPLWDATQFYEYITDSKVSTTTLKWPSNPESYLLISAGPDGKYGTKDDICNFDPSFP